MLITRFANSRYKIIMTIQFSTQFSSDGPLKTQWQCPLKTVNLHWKQLQQPVFGIQIFKNFVVFLSVNTSEICDSAITFGRTRVKSCDFAVDSPKRQASFSPTNTIVVTRQRCFLPLCFRESLLWRISSVATKQRRRFLHALIYLFNFFKLGKSAVKTVTIFFENSHSLH